MDWPTKRATLEAIGRGGYEGIHPDDQGNLILAEDVGGTEVSVDPSDPSAPEVAKQPNSFIYRFVPKNPADLTKGGKLQALQVKIQRARRPIPCREPVGRRLLPGPARAAHARHVLAGAVDHDPRHRHERHRAVRRERAREGRRGHPVRAAGEPPVPTRVQLPHVRLRGDRRHERRLGQRPRARGARGLGQPASRVNIGQRPAATSRSWPWATRCTHARSTTWHSPTATRSSPPRTAGTDCTRS